MQADKQDDLDLYLVMCDTYNIAEPTRTIVSGTYPKIEDGS